VLTDVKTAIVRSPGGYANAGGQTLFGAGGIGTQVYGLFANDDGSDLHWRASAPAFVPLVDTIRGQEQIAV
jgi:hypothetical protein